MIHAIWRLSGCERRASDLTKKNDQLEGVRGLRCTQLIIDISLNMSVYEIAAAATHEALAIALCASNDGASV